jgi:hypothetical protein
MMEYRPGKSTPARLKSIKEHPPTAAPLLCRSSSNESTFRSTLDPTRHDYNVLEVVRLLGPLNIEALQSSIATICAATKYSDLRSSSD